MMLKAKCAVVLVVMAMVAVTGVGGASAHTDDHPCDEHRPELEFRGFTAADIDWALDKICPREGGHAGGRTMVIPGRNGEPDRVVSTLHLVNDSGEYSMGPMQMNYASGFHRARGISKAWIAENWTNYWDAFVVLWNECGRGPWTKIRRNGKVFYDCTPPPPSRRAVRATDRFLEAMASQAMAMAVA